MYVKMLLKMCLIWGWLADLIVAILSNNDKNIFKKYVFPYLIITITLLLTILILAVSQQTVSLTQVT